MCEIVVMHTLNNFEPNIFCRFLVFRGVGRGFTSDDTCSIWLNYEAY